MKTLTAQIIIKTVADYFKRTAEEVISTDQHGDIIIARHIAMYYIKDYLKLSLAQTGKFFAGRNKYKDHASVLHAIRSINNQVETNMYYKRVLGEIKVFLDSAMGKPVPVIEIEEIKESVLVHENNYLKNEIVRLKNEVSMLHGKIYGLKLNKRKLKRRTRKPVLFKLSDIKPIETRPVKNSIYAGIMSCTNREYSGYREHSL